MLEVISGNKSVEHILFFLLINERCYATELHQRLNLPLTPLQQALKKLEKAGVLVSYCEGKTRFFTFDQRYPLLYELENFLKKAYTLIPLEIQKNYFNPKCFSIKYQGRKISPSIVTEQLALTQCWEKLTKIKTMCFSAKSKAQSVSGWNGAGKGSVETQKIDEQIMVFNEKGSWLSVDKRQMNFKNVFRWTLSIPRGTISLEHLRFGPQHPVFLFDLVPIDAHTLESIDSHVCQGDTYFGQVHCHNHFIQFNWRVIGPKKNEEIDYIYTE